MIKKEFEAGVLTLILNRPEVYNSFNREMSLELQQALDAAEADETVRCIIITGEGKGFCAGQDLGEAIDENGPELKEIVDKHYNPMITRIRNIEKPIIAAVNGIAAGAGANIALACDIVVADENAAFIQAFSKIGLIPDSAGTFFLPRLIGMQKASALMMTGEKVMAKEAEEMGMIYKCFSTEVFEVSTKKMAAKLAKMPTKALGLTKLALNKSYTNDLDTQLALESDLQVECGQTHDFKEGIDAFLEKRKPVFKGQ